MKIHEVTPELAHKMGNAYLECLCQMGVEKMSTSQMAIWNGLYALEYLESAYRDLCKEPLAFATVELTNRLEHLELMYAESKPYLVEYLKSFP